jgi:hypothetical protein
MFAPTLSHAVSLQTESPTKPKRLTRKRRPRFGSQANAQVYEAAQALITQHKLLRMYEFTQTNAIKRLVICNLWAIERVIKTGSIRLFEFQLITGQWKPVTRVAAWPLVPLFPIASVTTLKWWKDVVTRTTQVALDAAGWRALEFTKRALDPTSLSNVLVARFIGTHKRGGVLTEESRFAAARGLRAVLWDHFIDKSIVSAMLKMDFRTYSLTQYLYYALRGPAVLKVMREQPTLLPLLSQISPKYWGKDDLFSAKNWVQGPSSAALIMQTVFNSQIPLSGLESLTRRQLYPCGARFTQFTTGAGYRWLCKAPITTVRAWIQVEGGNKRVATVENIARANISVAVPSIVWQALLSANIEQRYQTADMVARLYNVFVSHCNQVWKKEGFKALKQLLKEKTQKLAEIVDWLNAEGHVQGHPQKGATWASLCRRSDDWHKRVVIDSMNALKNGIHSREWVSELGETTIAGHTFRPLTTEHALALEGYEQDHCVGNYAYDCVKGVRRIFAASDSQNNRSTLSLYKNAQHVWRVSQHLAIHNRDVAAATHAAGKMLATAYNEAFSKKARNSKPNVELTQ